MDAFVTVVPAQPRQRAPSPPRALTQLLISDLRKVAPVETATRAVQALRAALDAPPAELLAALEAVGRYYFSLELLEETGAGVLVHRLRTHADGGVAAKAEGLYAQWRADAKAAVLRREKRRSKEGGGADGGGGGKKKARTSAGSGSSSAAAATADGIDRGADDARDTRRDFMVAPELDLAREVEEWEAASAHAAWRKPHHAPSSAAVATDDGAGAAAASSCSSAAAAPTSAPLRLARASSSSSGSSGADGRRQSAPGLLPVSALPNRPLQRPASAAPTGSSSSTGAAGGGGSSSSAPRRQSLPIAASGRPTLHASPAAAAATSSSSSSSSAGLTLLPAAAAPAYPALQLVARPSPASAAAAAAVSHHRPRLSLPGAKR